MLEVEVVLLLSDEKLEAIAELCRAYGVKRLVRGSDGIRQGIREWRKSAFSGFNANRALAIPVSSLWSSS